MPVSEEETPLSGDFKSAFTVNTTKAITATNITAQTLKNTLRRTIAFCLADLFAMLISVLPPWTDINEGVSAAANRNFLPARIIRRASGLP